MADNESVSDAHPEHTPDFEMVNRDVIHEDNWAEYDARGFMPYGDDARKGARLEAIRRIFGVQHVYTGDSFDEDAGRPLRYKPGTGIYVSPEGAHKAAEISRKERGRQTHSGDDPAAS